MRTFEIKDTFLLDGEPFQIISGSIHYFRVVPEYWQDRLEKLKNMGCNTVETYIPWNLTEPKKGEFNFEGFCDFEKFLDLAQKLGLYAIVRPSPYICAEWELGGLPSWIFTVPGLEPRCKNEPYYHNVRDYYKVLLPRLVNHQIDKGGNIILMQIENEYGYYGKDMSYLQFLADLMRENGITVPFVTSDGPWGKMFIHGQCNGALPTGNFGSHARPLFANMKRMMKKTGNRGPLMCMEFWIGWFDAWGNKEHKTSNIKRNIKDLNYMLKKGNVNFYMFHGGTNFGFMNGSNYFTKLTPDVTSYDYDAPLSEDGKITEKYRVFQGIIKKYRDFEEIPLSTKISQKAYGVVKAEKTVRLFDILPQLAQAKSVEGADLPCMEKAGQDYGYIIYETKAAGSSSSLKIENGHDRIIGYKNEVPRFTLFDKETASEQKIDLAAGDKLTLMVENLGRVNFADKIPFQRKGINGKVLADGTALSNWNYYCLNLDGAQLSKINWDAPSGKDDTGVTGTDKAPSPTFTRLTFDVTEACDTYLDFTGWGKGCIFLNGFNLGRFWEIGPQRRLYVPAPLLKSGKNELIIFESEGKTAESVEFFAEHKLS